MSKLEDLVPQLELCKMIPKGEFEDCALMWIEVETNQKTKTEWQVCHRNKWFNVFTNQKHSAPTLQEIMADMPYCRVYKKTANFYVAVKEKDRVVSFNGATAALKLWLKLKGIDYEK